MYFIYPSRELRQLDKALILFADIEWVKLTLVEMCDPNQIYIADVHDFLNHQWDCPTVVIALEDEGAALSQAWQKGALAGWIWEDLPEQPFDKLQQIEAQYKRNQDSRDLPTAAELQRRLLPSPEQFQQYQFKYLFQPTAYLSGDWIDFWQVDEHKILFYLADVSGHGVTSSLLTSWLAGFHKRAHSPEHLVLKLNEMLIKENIEKHITMIAGMIDLESHQLQCINAGHFPPALHICKGQEPQIFHSSSFPLGLTEDLKVEKVVVDMHAESQFIICSDGALEPYKGGINDQFQLLLQDLQAGNFNPPAQVNDDIAMLKIIRSAESHD
ncbi:Stage II sporulation protein E (SpoIIE) [Acinetobacter marinus]|uniref:Stage II sporulation protein E (SpoIIE) n=1 Tax=Acinetobacter marinus TaxID=281375 RepID=A0A1G6HV61_9GAMM|nr:SpoIIE family protein phosphatase [Acinetobacter marinus]SDB98033.1 Stage II sporulation protein E (SpoIIE) [Acinetobacter marinus]